MLIKQQKVNCQQIFGFMCVIGFEAEKLSFLSSRDFEIYVCFNLSSAFQLIVRYYYLTFIVIVIIIS